MESVVINLFPNFAFWKLHSLKEYLLFFLMLASGIALLFTRFAPHEEGQDPRRFLEADYRSRAKTKSWKSPHFTAGIAFTQGCDLLVLLNRGFFGYLKKRVYRILYTRFVPCRTMENF